MKMIPLYAMGILLIALNTSHAAETKTTITEKDGQKTTTTRYYYDNDLNKNGIIDNTEFPSYVYSRWDRNNDGYLSSEEWNNSSMRWYGSKSDVKTYTAWDKNNDGKLDPSEFDLVVNNTKLYNTWDRNADNIIEMNEYSAATFDIYDENNDGQLSLSEWERSQ